MGPLNQEITLPLPFLVSRGSSVQLMLWHGEYSTLNNRGEEECLRVWKKRGKEKGRGRNGKEKIGREAEGENEG